MDTEEPLLSRKSCRKPEISEQRRLHKCDGKQCEQPSSAPRPRIPIVNVRHDKPNKCSQGDRIEQNVRTANVEVDISNCYRTRQKTITLISPVTGQVPPAVKLPHCRVT